MLDLVFTALALLSVTFIVKKVLRWRQLRQFSISNGCQAARSEHPYDVLGFINIYQSVYHLLKSTALKNMVNLFDKYGQTFASRILTQTVFLTCEPRNLKHVLVTRFADYDSAPARIHLFKDITAHGIFAVDGQAWRSARDVYRDEFSHTRSILDLQRQERHVQNLLPHVPSGTPFDIQPLFKKLMLDMTTAFAFGESADMLSPTQSEKKREFTNALLYVKETMARDGFMGPLYVILSHKKFHKDIHTVHEYVEGLIRNALEKKQQQPQTKETGDDTDSEGYNMLQALTGYTSDVVALRDALVTVLIAGIDSVASLLSTTFFLLARDERVFRKLRKSIVDSIGHREPTYDDIKSNLYLRYVFNEAMRVYPPVPFNTRTANKDTTLPYGGGPDGTSSILVPKGERVIFSSWATHRSVQSFGDDAHEFRPERWENRKAEFIGYIPFNLGPRACPGQHYALAEASYVTIRLLQTFSKLESRDARIWTEKLGLNLGHANGVMVELTRADNNM